MKVQKHALGGGGCGGVCFLCDWELIFFVCDLFMLGRALGSSRVVFYASICCLLIVFTIVLKNSLLLVEMMYVVEDNLLIMF